MSDMWDFLFKLQSKRKKKRDGEKCQRRENFPSLFLNLKMVRDKHYSNPVSVSKVSRVVLDIPDFFRLL